MPLNSTQWHTYSIRRRKAERALLVEIARRLGTTPTALIREAFERRLPALKKQAKIEAVSSPPRTA